MLFLIKRNICKSRSSTRQWEEQRWWERGQNIHQGWAECVHWGDNTWLPWIIQSSSLHGLSWQRHIHSIKPEQHPNVCNYNEEGCARKSTNSKYSKNNIYLSIHQKKITHSRTKISLHAAFTTLSPPPCFLSLSLLLSFHIMSHTCSHLLTTPSVDLNWRWHTGDVEMLPIGVRWRNQWQTDDHFYKSPKLSLQIKR